MDMVGHENLCVHGHIEFGRAVSDTVSEICKIIIAGEANVSVVTSLDNMNRASGRAIVVVGAWLRNSRGAFRAESVKRCGSSVILM
jgi:hypothetical protein